MPMSVTVSNLPAAVSSAAGHSRPVGATTEPRWVRAVLIGVAVAFLGLFLLVPLLAVFVQAFEKGAPAFFRALWDPDSRSAVGLTLLTAAVTVPLSTIFGLVAAWAIGKFHFRGKNVLLTLIDLPFSVSPVIAGLIFVLIFSGTHGWLGPSLEHWGIKIIFAVPGIIIVTMFVTAPFVARELIPLMQAQGTEEEEAARVLGASGWQTFWRVTLPNVKWALLYGIILCNARAMGEFGAVSVVSGHIRGRTNTMPLHVECLYNGSGADSGPAAAFAVASLLAVLAMLTLVLKSYLEWKTARQLARAGDCPDLRPSENGTVALETTGRRDATEEKSP
jgi:sulfate transport system permease protein